jgi:transcriptional regulator with XRE-family HTH domain
VSKSPDILVSFGRRVRDLRQARELSQEAFAETCGLDRTYISGIERGKRNVSLRNLRVIAEALGVDLSKLLQGL